MKLLLDMNIAPRWATYLTVAGMTAVHWTQVGPATATDAAIMAPARTENFVVHAGFGLHYTLGPYTRTKAQRCADTS